MTSDKTEWRAEDRGKAGWRVVILAGGLTEKIIAEFLDKHTAHLIAAASDMREALQRAEIGIAALADWYVSDPRHNVSFAARTESIRRAIRAALAKAKPNE